MSRSEPVVDWIEIQLTIVAVMKVDANTNRISLDARPLHGAGRSLAGSGARSWDAAVLTRSAYRPRSRSA